VVHRIGKWRNYIKEGLNSVVFRSDGERASEDGQEDGGTGGGGHGRKTGKFE
jgi:hypothetical protein